MAPCELWDMERASKLWWADTQELLAWVSANIMSASSGKRIRPQKLFNRKKYLRGEKEPYDLQEWEEANKRSKGLLKRIRGGAL